MGTLIPLRVTAPGFYGLNKQNTVGNDLHWASECDNTVIDAKGRLAVRKARLTVTSAAISGTPRLRSLFEQVLSNGTTVILSAAAAKLYSGTSTLTDITGTAGGGTGITDAHWQFQNINNNVVGFQSGHDPIFRTTGNFSLLQQQLSAWTTTTAYVVGDVVRATSGNLTIYFHCTVSGTSGGTEPTWVTGEGGTTTDGTVTWTTRVMPTGNVCHSAFSRIWVTGSNPSIIEFSDTLLPAKFRGGAAGTLDLKTVWAGDIVIAISSFENLLVIFGRKTVLLYTGASDPTTMALSEKLEGVGTFARDSLGHTGNDLLFLSDSGVRLLSRTVASGGKEPLGDLSVHVRDDMMASAVAEDVDVIKAAYHEPEGFYAISFPAAGYDYVFDLRFPNPDRTPKITRWRNFGSTAYFSARDRNLYCGGAGVVARYSGYNDGTTGTYAVTYRSTWVDIVDPSWAAGRIKIPKHWNLKIITNKAYQIVFVWGYDYDETLSSSVANIVTRGTGSEWGVFEWGIGEWSGSDSFASLRENPTGNGTVMRFGFNLTVDGSPFALQQLNILYKLGRFE